MHTLANTLTKILAKILIPKIMQNSTREYIKSYCNLLPGVESAISVTYVLNVLSCVAGSCGLMGIMREPGVNGPTANMTINNSERNSQQKKLTFIMAHERLPWHKSWSRKIWTAAPASVETPRHNHCSESHSRLYRVSRKSKPDHYCRNFVYCQPLFLPLHCPLANDAKLSE